MKKPEAILCLDIDGTLIDEREQIHSEDVKLVNNYPKTIQLILTTGRPLGSAKGVLYANKIYQDMDLPIPGVFMNGTAGYLREEKLVFQHHFPIVVLEELINLADHHQDSTFAFFTLSHVYLVHPTPFSLQVSEKHYLSYRISQTTEIPQKINKMMVIENNREKLQQIKNLTRYINAEIAYSLPYLLEFSPKGINKPAALKTLLSELKLDGKPMYAVGDGQNDLALFELAEISFAPSTAHEKIKHNVDQVIKREEKGILKPILEIINQNNL